MAIANKPIFCRLLVGCFLLLFGALVHAQEQTPEAPNGRNTRPMTQSSASAVGSIRGLVKSGNMPIPGAAVSISLATSSVAISTWTEVDGSYSAAVPSYGVYTVQVQMVAFANRSQQVVVNASQSIVQTNFELTLLSRTRKSSPQPRQPTAEAASRRRFQNLSIPQSMTGQDSTGAPSNDVVPSGMPVPGIDPNSATESIAVMGNASNSFNGMSSDELQQRANDARQQGGGFGTGGFGGPGAFVGAGPGGGGPGGFGGGGGGRAMTVFGRRGFDINHLHGSIYHSAGNSALNAAPYSLTGQPSIKPGYMQNSFGASVGGPLNIPKIYRGGAKTFFFVNYNGKRGSNPFDQFSTVPTLLERQGNFSQTTYTSGALAGQPVQIVDPATNNPLPNSTLPQINPVAQALLQYIPEPNLPGNFQNFHFVTSANNSSDDLNARINHTFGAAAAGRRRGRGGSRNNLTFGLHYHESNANITNPFPSIGGSTSVRSFDVPIGYIRSIGKLTNSLRFDFNRSRTRTQNLYGFKQNIASDVGISGVSTAPFDWGLPNLSFTNFVGLQDVSPQFLRNQTYSFSDYVVWTHGKHSLRWGGDFRRIQVNTETSGNARGSFTFTGIDTGYDLADFLYEGVVNGQTVYGLPQQTSVQYGDENYHFHGN